MTPGSDCINHANRAEKEHNRGDQNSAVDARETNSPEGPQVNDPTDEKDRLRSNKPYVVGTRNVRGMSTGKLDIIKREMERTKVDIMGISELH